MPFSGSFSSLSLGKKYTNRINSYIYFAYLRAPLEIEEKQGKPVKMDVIGAILEKEIQMQPSFFDLSDRYEQLSSQGDPLERLNDLIDWNVFLPLLRRAFNKCAKSNAGRKPYNRLMMFKVLVLQSLYNLSDAQTEYQIRDRLSFMRFLNLHLEDAIPDEKTIWSFREVLIESGMIERLFSRFNEYMENQGLMAETGMIVDASIVACPKQRNHREENKTIKSGKTPKSFTTNPHRHRQKDVHARWAIKHGKTYYGYKDHILIDVKHKLIRHYAVTPASTSDIHCLSRLIHGQRNEDRRLWADEAYSGERTEKLLKRYQITSRVHHRTKKGGWILDQEKRENRRRSKIRKRVEHVFGFIQNSLGGKLIRTIGIKRARAKIGLMNLAHNFCRYEQIVRLGVG